MGGTSRRRKRTAVSVTPPPPSTAEKPSGSGSKRRRGPLASTSTAEGDPVKGPKSLGSALLQRTKEDDPLADVTFILRGGKVGEGEERLRAHALVVREGSQTLGDLIQRKVTKVWGGGGIDIHLPSSLCLERRGVQAFLSYLYTGALAEGDDDPADLSDLLSLLGLSDHFGMPELNLKCLEGIQGSLAPSNAPLIFQATLPLVKSPICEEALGVLRDGLRALLDSKEDEGGYLDWSQGTWRALLPTLEGEQLIAAFKALKKWRDERRSEREEAFQRLGKCVRFHSFGSASAVADVVSGTTGVLTQAETLELFMFFAGGEKTVRVGPKDDLQKALDRGGKTWIHLSAGTFRGPKGDGVFTLSKSGTHLVGSGSGTIIEARLVIESDECVVSDLAISSGGGGGGTSTGDSSSTLAMTSMTPASQGNPLIIIKGNSNTLAHLQLLQGSGGNNPGPSTGGNKSRNGGTSEWTPASKRTTTKRGKKEKETEQQEPSDGQEESTSAVLCFGNGNKLTNISSSVPSIFLCGDENRVTALTFLSTHNGLTLQGDRNTVDDVLFFPRGVDDPSASAVRVAEGHSNKVSHISFVQVPQAPFKYPSMLNLGPSTSATKVRNCSSGGVVIEGEKQEVVGVRVAPRFSFTLKGSGHTLADCDAESDNIKNEGSNVSFAK